MFDFRVVERFREDRVLEVRAVRDEKIRVEDGIDAEFFDEVRAIGVPECHDELQIVIPSVDQRIRRKQVPGTAQAETGHVQDLPLIVDGQEQPQQNIATAEVPLKKCRIQVIFEIGGAVDREIPLIVHAGGRLQSAYVRVRRKTGRL